MITKQEMIQLADLVGRSKSKFYVNAYIEGWTKGVKALDKVRTKQAKKDRAEQRKKEQAFIKTTKNMFPED